MEVIIISLRRNWYLYTKYKEKHPICEKCGSNDGVEVHHKIPLVLCGDDTIDNLISLCYSCHMKEHALNRSGLTKAGLERRKNAPIKDILISKIDLLEKIQNGELTDPLDIVDCIIDAPCKKCITENY